ncbi:uncharacterized protein LOC133315991 isoform X2 [Gastrolobium bilobum]|uniref:uncharacterized protein LOC133315991 isoform X2 n=1 Tax=Gastrolobium bilobum TaxID=150636 RepID=UPI002AB0231F|nr:uncharacterized protein LOC133315991 isoform X2 [Gastrolobium bilobum]
MGSRYEVEVKLTSARGLKNVNWRNGANRPYVVVWVDPSNKLSTRVDENGDTEANWDQTLVIPLPPKPLEDMTLYIDVVHAGSEKDTKPLIGSARLRLVEVLDDVGFGERASRTLTLKRPSGRPHGKVDVKVTIRDPGYRAQGGGGYYAPPYGVPPPPKKKSKFGGMGTGLAVGAVAGVLGGIALVEGAEYVENKIADDAAEKVEDDLRYDDGGYDDGGYGGDDF